MSTAQLTLDPATSALVLIDLQYGIVAMNVHPQSSTEVIARAKLKFTFPRIGRTRTTQDVLTALQTR